MSYGVSGSTNRIVGMASGLDVDAIVKSLMETEQLKVDAISQKKTQLEWKTDAYKDVNTMITDFRNKYFSALSPATALHLESAYNAKSVVTSTNQYATISAGSSTFEGPYTINEIKSLATGANVESKSLDISTTTALADLVLDPPLVFVGNMVMFSINGEDFEFNNTDTLQNVLNEVNSRSATGVTMSYSSLSGKISIKSKKLGAGTDFDFHDISGNFLGAFGFTEVSKGTDAVLKINNYDVVRKSNSFTIDGINYNLLKTTEAGTTIDFTVSQNVDSTYNKISDFVKGYNELIDKLNAKLSEEKYRTFLPLTDKQKEAMNEKDIEAWEKKAKSGLLKGDDNIKRLLADIRNAFGQAVTGVGISSSEVGITTGYWAEKGKLYINESKLRDAIANNTAGVKNLFIKSSAATDFATKLNESGIVERINNSMKSYSSFLNSNTLTYTKEQISNYSDKVTEAIARMNEKEGNYYKQYAALEAAMSKLNSQSTYFSSLLGNGNQ